MRNITHNFNTVQVAHVKVCLRTYRQFGNKCRSILYLYTNTSRRVELIISGLILEPAENIHKTPTPLCKRLPPPLNDREQSVHMILMRVRDEHTVHMHEELK